MDKESKELKHYLGKQVVIDTKSPIVYIGTLEKIGEYFITLGEVDVYDSSEGSSRKEVYVHEAHKYGIRKNRRRTEVRKSEVISISMLEDIIEF